MEPSPPAEADQECRRRPDDPDSVSPRVPLLEPYLIPPPRPALGRPRTQGLGQPGRPPAVLVAPGVGRRSSSPSVEHRACFCFRPFPFSRITFRIHISYSSMIASRRRVVLPSFPDCVALVAIPSYPFAQHLLSRLPVRRSISSLICQLRPVLDLESMSQVFPVILSTTIKREREIEREDLKSASLTSPASRSPAAA